MILVDFYKNSVRDLPSEYYACVIVAVSFAFLELILTSIFTAQLKTLKKIAIKHIMNEKGIEVDYEGQPIQKKASLGRLIKIARPVSLLYSHIPDVVLLYNSLPLNLCVDRPPIKKPAQIQRWIIQDEYLIFRNYQ